MIKPLTKISIIYACDDHFVPLLAASNNWYELDNRWNHFVNSPDTNGFLTHYIGLKPTYSEYPYGKPYRTIFFSYLNQAAWLGMSPLSKTDQGS